MRFMKRQQSTALFGYIRPLPRFASSGQQEALLAYGVHPDRICVEGHNGETLDGCIRLLRPGDVLAVRHLHLLAPPKLRTVDKPRRDLWAAVREIEARGASIFEVSAHRSSLKRDERDAMIADAIEALTHAGRSPRKGRPQPGRPPLEFSEKEVEQARRAWFDIRHRTNDDALRASPKGWTKQRSYDEFGPSGRSKR
jgi:hypothetical protein